jgi:hypothetical protein
VDCIATGLLQPTANSAITGAIVVYMVVFFMAFCQ